MNMKKRPVCSELLWSYCNHSSTYLLYFFFSSRRRHTRCLSDWSSDVCSSDLLVDDPVALVEEVVEVADDGAEVLAGRDRAPSADGMEPDRDRLVGQQRRRVVQIGRASCRERVESAVGAGGGKIV